MMRQYINLFENNVTESKKTFVYSWIKENMTVPKKLIHFNNDNTVSITQPLGLTGHTIKLKANIPPEIQFKSIAFNLLIEEGVSTLKGCPNVVEGEFTINSYNITSLEGGPKVVGDGYAIRKAKITTLKHVATDILKSGFFLLDNQATINPWEMRYLFFTTFHNIDIVSPIVFSPKDYQMFKDDETKNAVRSLLAKFTYLSESEKQDEIPNALEKLKALS